MRAPLLVFLVAAATAQGPVEDTPWKPNTNYEYAVEGRTLTALHQVSNQYSGIVMRAKVDLQLKTDNIVTMQVKSAEYSDVHTNMSEGWSSQIPDSQLHYQQINMSYTPVELQYRKGMIRGMMVSKDTPIWELNLMKSIVNQLQVDTRAENLMKSRMNSLPNKDNINGVYKTMEESIGGLCETLYDISPLPKVQLMNRPELAPFPHLQPDGKLIDIVKTRNFSNCDVIAEYHFGYTGLTDWMPSSNQLGNFLARSSMSRVIISGSLDRYTIQSATTTSKVIASPFLFDDQKGMVVSHINVTLNNIKSTTASLQSPPNPQTIPHLIYEYSPETTNKNRQTKMLEKYSIWQIWKNSESDSSSSSGEEPIMKISRLSALYGSKDSANNDKLSMSAQKQDEYPQIIHMSHKEWLKKFRPDIYNKVMTFKNINNITSPKTYPALSSSSEASSLSSSDDISSGSGKSDLGFLWKNGDEDTWHPNLNEAPSAPFLPMFTGNEGNSIQFAKEIQIMSSVRKIAQEIAREIQNPSSIPGQMTLSKFTVLIQILQTMNEKQLTEATKEMYFSQSPVPGLSSSDIEKYHAWVAFRDAVAQAGTGPALIALDGMIKTKKVQGEEAAQLVSVLPNSARFPNTEYMDKFFDLVTCSHVAQQNLLNVSAVISFAELARKAFVSRSSAYKRFPIYVYGPLMSKKNQPVFQKYIPYFARMLKESVKNGDSMKIGSMITALGNLAHPRILRVFEPYLEGREPVTHFQRLTMVVALNRMAKVFPNAARPVLFRIYQNTGESSEVRVAAVFQIMKTNPPRQMLQRMAQFTHDDQDLQVVSAVQSAIRSAATLASPSDHELMMNAQAAVNLLTPKELPAQMSKKKVHSYWARQLNLAYKQAISYIGSDDSFLPSSVFYSLRRNLGGFNRQTIGFSAMSSSPDAMVSLMMKQLMGGSLSNQQKRNFNKWMGHTTTGTAMPRPETTTRQHTRSDMGESSSSLSTEEIYNMLNIQPRKQQPLEASLYMTTLLGKRYFAVDNHTIEQLPKMMMKTIAALKTGENFNYAKITDKLSVTSAFPMAMGLPFVFTLKNPTLIMLTGSAKAQSQPDLASGDPMLPHTFNASASLRFVYSSRTQSQMGFVAPFNRQQYIAGVSKNMQVNIPIKSNVDLDLVNRKITTKIQFLDQEKKQNLVEYSTVPYTAKRNILQLVQNPQEEMQVDNDRKKIVHVRPMNQIHKTIGKDSTGLAFEFDYFSEQKFIDFAAVYNEAHKHDSVSAIIFGWAENSINFNNITLGFNPLKSSAKYAKFTATYLDDSDNKQNSNSYSKSQNKNEDMKDESNQGAASVSVSMAQAVSSAPDSQTRQQQFLSNVGKGIQDSSAMLVDLSAEFLGQTNASFVATFAAATSYTSPKSRYLFFADAHPANSNSNNRQSQVCMAAETLMPNVPLMNFIKALNSDPASNMNAEIVFGEKCNQYSSKISIQGKMKRTEKRHQFMDQMPLSQLCKKEMQEGNTATFACRNVTMHANCMDQYRFSVQYDKIPSFWKNVTYKAYSLMRFAGYQYVSEDLISPNNPSNRVEVNANYAPDLSSLNVTIKSPMLSAQFTNLRVNRMIQPLIVVNPEYSAIQRVAEFALQGQQFPTCVVDNNQAETFDNKSYPVRLGQFWHVMMQYAPKINSDDSVSGFSDDMQDISVLVRDASSNNNKEVMIIMGENTVHMEPSGNNKLDHVVVNGKSLQIQQDSLTQAMDSNGQIIAQVYVLPSGAIRMFAPQQNMEFQYDGSAIKIRAPNSYRSKVRGLCGTLNSQSSDDFTVPANCVMQDPFDFAAMYAVEVGSGQSQIKALKLQAQKASCFLNTVVYGNVITDRETNMERFNIRPNRENTNSMTKKYSSCANKRIIIVKKDTKVCFSLKPYLRCSDGCKSQGSTDKQIEVFCAEPTAATQHWQEMIQQGKIPDFSQKKPTQSLIVNIPENCFSSQ